MLSPAISLPQYCKLESREERFAETLSGQAEQARNEQQLEAEKLAQEVGVKLLLPLVTCFFPVTFLLILGPIFIGYMQPQ